MALCISHWTALRWLLRNFASRHDGSDSEGSRPLLSGAPRAEEVREALDYLALRLPLDDGAGRAIDVLVAERGLRRGREGLRCHLCSGELPRGSVIPAGIRGYDLMVTSPELTFVQIAAVEDVRVAAYAGMALCSGYRLDEFEDSGLADRADFDEPLTSVGAIAAFLRRAKGLRGVRAAERALAFVRDGALSPPEGGIAELALLPYRLGGYACKDVSLNRGIRVLDRVGPNGERHYTTRFPDVTILARDPAGVRRIVGIDYDPRLTHGGEAKRQSDVERGNQINGARKITHFTFTELQRKSFPRWRSSMEQVRIALGQRPARRDGRTDAYDAERWEAWHMLLESPPVL
ncbi:hypothetical protein H6A23_07645 [Olsenella uli]|uniref:hypothetical protein n=1 Tax=Olsenella uli TaxID=133926 RepID=UPI0019587775|nr:hypothetical protein [Olsenella uli]MBM6817033.1 hypothetical protein [Olsenella uli]